MENMKLEQIVDSLEEQKSLLRENILRLNNEFPFSKNLGLEELEANRQKLCDLYADITGQINILADIFKQISALETTISGKKEMIKNICEDIKKNKRFKFFLSSQFDALSLISIFYGALLVNFTVGLSVMGFINFSMFAIAYMSSCMVMEAISKKTINDILLEKLIPEYVGFNNDVLKFEREIEDLGKTRNQVNDFAEKVHNEYDRIDCLLEILNQMIRSKNVADFVGHMPVDIFRRLANLQEEAQKFELTLEEKSATEEEPPKVKSIGTMPGSETL